MTGSLNAEMKDQDRKMAEIIGTDRSDTLAGTTRADRFPPDGVGPGEAGERLPGRAGADILRGLDATAEPMGSAAPKGMAKTAPPSPARRAAMRPPPAERTATSSSNCAASAPPI